MKRYRIISPDGAIFAEECSDGDWISYHDHLAEVNRLKEGKECHVSRPGELTLECAVGNLCLKCKLDNLRGAAKAYLHQNKHMLAEGTPWGNIDHDNLRRLEMWLFKAIHSSEIKDEKV